MKESKCVFFAKEIQYLAHITSAKGMRMDPEKVEAILKWLAPKNLQELQIFLDMSGFYRQYVRDYAKIYVPMIDQLQSKSKDIHSGRPNIKALKNQRWLL